MCIFIIEVLEDTIWLAFIKFFCKGCSFVILFLMFNAYDSTNGCMKDLK